MRGSAGPLPHDSELAVDVIGQIRKVKSAHGLSARAPISLLAVRGPGAALRRPEEALPEILGAANVTARQVVEDPAFESIVVNVRLEGRSTDGQAGG